MPTAEDEAFLCFTSGTTGMPKAAMVSHCNMVAACRSSAGTAVFPSHRTRYLSWMPCPHIAERVSQLCVLCEGGSFGFFQGSPLKISDDIKAIRPTFFPTVPMLLDKIKDKIEAKVAGGGALKAAAFNKAMASKKGKPPTKETYWDRIVLQKVAKKIGLDQVDILASGAAPLNGATKDFIVALVGAPVLECYGSTECTGAASCTCPSDSMGGQVGFPSSCSQVCLVSVQDMNYLHTDTEHKGVPCRGRGEICVRGPNVFIGYYKLPDKTRETLDRDGWLHTGDIGLWTSDGKLKIIDRKKNLFKLANGEYVAPEKVEGFLSQSPLIARCFVHGDSLQDRLVAVVVPDEEALQAWWNKSKKSGPGARSRKPSAVQPIGAGEAGSFASLCQNQYVVKAVLNSLEREAKKKNSKLESYEVPLAIHLEPAPWLPETGLVTPTLKLKRLKLREHYKHVIARLYEPDAGGTSDGAPILTTSEVCSLCTLCVVSYV